jgi:hypothetical protein
MAAAPISPWRVPSHGCRPSSPWPARHGRRLQLPMAVVPSHGRHPHLPVAGAPSHGRRPISPCPARLPMATAPSPPWPARPPWSATPNLWPARPPSRVAAPSSPSPVAARPHRRPPPLIVVGVPLGPTAAPSMACARPVPATTRPSASRRRPFSWAPPPPVPVLAGAPRPADCHGRTLWLPCPAPLDGDTPPWQGQEA